MLQRTFVGEKRHRGNGMRAHEIEFNVRRLKIEDLMPIVDTPEDPMIPSTDAYRARHA